MQKMFPSIAQICSSNRENTRERSPISPMVPIAPLIDFDDTSNSSNSTSPQRSHQELADENDLYVIKPEEKLDNHPVLKDLLEFE